MALSYQLYSSRNHGPIEATLSMLSDLGYDEVEGYGGIFGDPGRLRDLLAENGLRMPTAHVALDLLEQDPDTVVTLARTLGWTTVFCPFVAAEARPSDADGWRAFGRRIDEAGGPIRDAGLDFGWHNHDFEFLPLDAGLRPIDAMFEAAENLGWEADLAWVVRGGGDPMAEIQRYGDRILAVHVKDIAPDGENADEDGWADVGHGTLDWVRLMTALREQTRARHFVMEHDKPADDRRFAERSIATAREI